MAGKNRRKRRTHRARGTRTTRSKARQRQAASAPAIRASLATASDNKTAALSPSRELKVAQGSLQISAPVTPAFGWFGRMPMALLPARVFFGMGRPVAGLACCVLQASVLGWLPAALWAAWAQARVARKHRILAARLRSA
jgi:hypothetical protein